MHGAICEGAMGLLKKLKQGFKRTVDPLDVFDIPGIDKKKKKVAPEVDPDPINPLTGRPMSQNIPQDGAPVGTAAPMQGLGQMPPAYLPSPVSMQQRVPQGLGSNVFASTLAPLQQQGYGLGQVDPRFLQGAVRLPGGNTSGIPFQRPPWMMQ
jgi:hypothetical protein